MAITKTLSQFKSTLAAKAPPICLRFLFPHSPQAVDDTDWTTDYQNTFKFLCKAAPVTCFNCGSYQRSFQR